LSPAEAVLRYAGDFIPSWAGAISIDLMPAVLVLILCVVYAAIRREGLPAFSTSDMTAGQLVAALQMAREVGEARQATQIQVTADDVTTGQVNAEGVKPQRGSAVEPAAIADENITSLPSARHTK